MKKNNFDFTKIYNHFNVRICKDLDCGKYICGNSACCFPSKSGSFICFLPGELEFLQEKFKKRFPFTKLTNGHSHCRGVSFCLKEYRPIDCRSYPLWPLVQKRKFVGFVDCRGERCLLKAIPGEFIKSVKKSWEYVFKHERLLKFIESTYAKGPLIIFPEFEDEKISNHSKGKQSLSG